jgi:hypothetical protein
MACHTFFEDGNLVAESYDLEQARELAAQFPKAEWRIDGNKVGKGKLGTFAREVASLVSEGKKTRTDQEIVEQTNELARRFSRLQGYEAPEGHKFYEDGGDRMPCPWLLACVAQEFLTGTDPDDALSNLGE